MVDTINDAAGQEPAQEPAHDGPSIEVKVVAGNGRAGFRITTTGPVWADITDLPNPDGTITRTIMLDPQHMAAVCANGAVAACDALAFMAYRLQLALDKAEKAEPARPIIELPRG